MNCYQYKVIDSQMLADTSRDTLEACLNKLGKEGWELLGDTVRRDVQTNAFFAIVRKETTMKKETVYA